MFVGRLTYYVFRLLIYYYKRCGMDTISVYGLMEIDNAIIIDIRNFYYYNLGHIKGAISIPSYNLLNNHNHYLNKVNRYYMYCDTGEQSLELVRRLNLFGYDTVSVIGGYDEYKRVFG